MVVLPIRKISDDAIMPYYAKDGDAGFDLRSSEEVWIPPGEKRIVKTGISMAIPKDHVGLIWDRSGIAAKHGITCLAGVIDAGFRGDVRVVLHNLGQKEFCVEKNMRIAQMIINKIVHADFEEVNDLPETARNSGGFGHTGNS